MTILLGLGMVGIIAIFAGIQAWSNSRGKILILPEKTSYVAGEMIKGKIVVKMKKPTFANKLDLSLIASKKVSYNTVIPGIGGMPPRNERYVREDRIYKSTVTVHREDKYSNEALPFEILIPQDSDSRPGLKWSLVAELNIPNSLNLFQKIDIQIEE